jgi:hypothetical protein
MTHLKCDVIGCQKQAVCSMTSTKNNAPPWFYCEDHEHITKNQIIFGKSSWKYQRLNSTAEIRGS